VTAHTTCSSAAISSPRAKSKWVWLALSPRCRRFFIWAAMTVEMAEFLGLLAADVRFSAMDRGSASPTRPDFSVARLDAVVTAFPLAAAGWPDVRVDEDGNRGDVISG